jgi:hypothetical protein
MGIRGLWLASATVAVFVLLAIGVAVSLANRADRQAKATGQTLLGSSPCAKALLEDWTDGRIDGTYPIACYRDTLRTLPTDLRVYSSAADDIRAARSQRIVQSAVARSPRKAVRRAAG